MSSTPFIVAVGERRRVQSSTIDGGSSWVDGPTVGDDSSLGRLVVGVDTASCRLWISTIEQLRKGVCCGLPPTDADLMHLGWRSAAPGADIVVTLRFVDPLPPGGSSTWVVRFVDGLPRIADPSEADLELRCDLFLGMRVMLAGLPLREVSSRLAMRGDVLSTGVLVGAVARPEVLEGHGWLVHALAVAERTRGRWEPVVCDLLRGRQLT